LLDFSRYGLDVSRETVEKFEIYKRLLLKWQKAINLVSETTLEELDTRHFLDSTQLIKYIPNKNIVLADMGSGAGFPGMVLALLGVREVHLIESDVRKATFVREVSRETSTKVFVHDDRVEDVTIEKVDLVTARALATLSDLLRLSSRLAPGARCLFLKGEKTEEELEKARKRFSFKAELHQSLTDETGKIVDICFT